MAAITAKWNACPFCIFAHGAIASLVLGDSMVNAVLADIEQPIPSKELQATIVFSEKLTVNPDKINIIDVQTVLENEVTREELEDAIAVASLFSITARCANAFNFALLTKNDLEKSAKRMLVRGICSERKASLNVLIIALWRKYYGNEFLKDKALLIVISGKPASISLYNRLKNYFL